VGASADRVSGGVIVNGESRIDLLDELANKVRANHRWKWERRVSEDPRSARDAYVEMTEMEVTRAVDEQIAALEQQQIESYYYAIELLDYQDALASEFPSDHVGP